MTVVPHAPFCTIECNREYHTFSVGAPVAWVAEDEGCLNCGKPTPVIRRCKGGPR